MVQSGAQEVVAEIEHENGSVAARLDAFKEKKGAAMLGPSKISAAESRGQRPYQVRGGEILDLVCPEDALISERGRVS